MEFLSQTSISDSNIQCHSMFLDLHDFDNMLNGSHDTCFLIDVVGEVLDLGGLDIVQYARKEVNKLEFTLRDIKDQRLHCCITGRLAQMLTQEVNKLNNGDICLIRFAKLGIYNGEMRVSNAFDSSLVLINPDIKEVQALKQMFHGDDNQFDINQAQNEKLMVHKKRQKWSPYPFKTIQEMKHSDKVEKSRIVFDELDVPNWWCEYCQCSVQKVSPRFKLDLLVQDLTGESKFTLSDSAATFIVKTSAAKILKVGLDQIKNQEMLPPQIVDIVGKTYGFGISVDENNSSCVQFNAMRVWNLNDIMWKRIKSLHQISTSSRKKQCINVNEVENKDHEEDKENTSG
ncbi:hypothetical protein Bca101_043021 [Brassica carinata]